MDTNTSTNMETKSCIKCSTVKSLCEFTQQGKTCHDCLRKGKNERFLRWYHKHKQDIDYHELYLKYKERLLAKTQRYRERLRIAKAEEQGIPLPPKKGRGRPRKTPVATQ